ncbi:aldose 1-epimerase family protein [Streptacidiphilus jiangxiensis]|uniref:Aldose 1-epimerase n=1 Tax=Streptacidiphilus jiangxiensis TaxID=235985 RepID=A0A1H7LZ37_STRJI|nr:aldose 1-epimerase family protein [Streptacidiphilus jiangxiensis]SEL04191.1 aldose 1-epimerase [Streptacidiphilus jiangxiensis]
MADAHLSPNGPQQVIEAGDYRAVISGVGAGLRGLSHRGRPLVVKYPAEAQPPGGAGQLLIPWPNRVRDGRYRWRDEDRQLDLSEPVTGNASHGFTRFLPWRVVAEDAGLDSAYVRYGLRLYPMHGYPHILELTAHYELSEAGLSVEVAARNVGETVAPYGFGAHPYLTLGRGPGSIGDAQLEVPADTWLPVDDRKIPTGRESVEGTQYDFRKPRLLGTTELDTACTGLARDGDGLARVRLTEPDGGRGVELWLGEGLDWVQLYTGDTLPSGYRRAGIAVEPMSCPPNAFATGEDVVAIEPGARVAHRFGISAR